MKLVAFLSIMLFSLPASAESYFEGKWVWNEDCIGGGGCWQPPQGASAGVDLRTIEEQSRQGGNGGRGIFVSDAFSITGYKKLSKKDAENLMWDEFTVKSDPDGITGPRPLMPNKHGDMHLRVGKIHKVEKLDFASPQGEKVKAIWRKDFERMPNEKGRRFLGAIEKMHGVNPVPEVKPLEPHTTITEDWNCPDSTSLNCDLTWTEVSGTFNIISNQYNQTDGGVNGFARAESALSSADHYSQVVFSTYPTGGGSNQGGVGSQVRFNSGANTHYGGVAYYSGGTKYKFIWKWVAGVRTDIYAVTATTHPTAPFTVKTDISGSDLTLYFDASSVATATDTAITGNLYTGIYGFQFSATAYGDDFLASDGLSPTRRRAIIIS